MTPRRVRSDRVRSAPVRSAPVRSAPVRSDRVRSDHVRGGRERGSGVLSTTFGVTVFVVLLAWTAHLLVHLWRISTIDAVAHDAATDVAESGATGRELGAAEADALAVARDALGSSASDVELEFEPSAPDRVVLRVRAPGISLVPGRPDDDGIAAIDRRITVRRESVTG